MRPRSHTESEISVISSASVMPALSWQLHDEGGLTRVLFDGEISEQGNLASLLDEQLGQELLLDLKGIRRVNSVGVRDWINLLKALRASGRTFSLARCAVSVVGQLNMIQNFSGGGAVLSVMVPYFCSGCSQTQEELLTLEGQGIPEIKPIPCKSCSGTAEFDDVPERYFSFCVP
jgi:hypothetical protein